MVVESAMQQVRPHVQSEQEAVEAKYKAFGRFIERVESVSIEAIAGSATRTTAGAGVHRRVTASTERPIRKVRSAFEETIHQQRLEATDTDISLLETVRSELTETVAVALAPTTETSLTPNLRTMILDVSRARRTETDTIADVLKQEGQHLDDAQQLVDEVSAWLLEADEIPLTALDYDGLQKRHERLAAYRTQCQECLDSRQAFVDGTTINGSPVAITHRSFLEYIYEDFSVDYPILATVVKLDDICRQCQRTIRDHLVRRN